MQSDKCFSRTALGQNPLSPFSIRFPDKYRKIKSGTNTKHNLHPREVSVGQENCHANSRQIDKIKRVCNKSDGRSSVSKTILANTGCNGLMYRDYSKCKTLHDVSTDTCTALIETCVQRIGDIDYKVSTSARALELVVTGSQHCKGQIVVTEPYKQVDCHRCVQSGLGRKLGSSDCTRHAANNE